MLDEFQKFVVLGIGFAIGGRIWTLVETVLMGWWRAGTKPPPWEKDTIHG